MSRQSGFTLIEAMVTVSLAAIVLGIGIPSFQSLVTRSRISSETVELIALLNSARQTAIVQRQRVTLCPGAHTTACDDNWQDGARIFADHNGNGRQDEGETTLSVTEGRPGISTRWSAALNRHYVQYEPTGYTASTNGTFRICPLNGDVRQARAIIVNRLGRPRVSTDTNGDGIHENAQGQALTCP